MPYTLFAATSWPDALIAITGIIMFGIFLIVICVFGNE